jgi:hypothetical protein
MPHKYLAMQSIQKNGKSIRAKITYDVPTHRLNNLRWPKESARRYNLIYDGQIKCSYKTLSSMTSMLSS